MIVSCLYRKFRSDNPMRLSIRLQILHDTKHLFEISSEILRLISNVRYTLSEPLLIFFTISRYEFMTFWQVPLFFDNVCYFFYFFSVLAQVCSHVSLSRCFKFKVLSQIRHQFWFNNTNITFSFNYFKISTHFQF